MVIALSPGRVAEGRSVRWLPWVAAAGALAVGQLVWSSTEGFPASWDIGVSEPVNRFQSWVARNRTTNFFIADVLRPIGQAVQWGYNALLDVLLSMPWFWLPLAVFVVIIRSGRWISATGAAAGLLYTEVAGLREPTMQTVALSLLCVLLCIAIGGPIGIWAGLRPGSDRYLRPAVDILQSLPTTLYLAPAVLFFTIGQTPAAIATVAFAVGPLIRIAALGIREVPAASVEAGVMFGSSPRQLLWKVRLPQAAPTLVTGVNQTIMAALSMAVIAALVGAGGLGAEVFQTLQLRSPGRGLLVGMAIVAIAIAFDRLFRSLVDRPRWPALSGRRFWVGAGVGLLVVYVVGRLAGASDIPWTFDRSVIEPVDDFVIWIRDEFGAPLQTFNDFVVADIVIPIRDLLGTTIAWPVVIAAVAFVSWRLRGWGLAVFSVIGLTAVGLMGMWASSVETLAQLFVAVVVSVVVAIALGVFIGTRPRLEATLNPFFETLQTLPSVIYMVPFTMVFAVGYLPGILATALYSIPAGVRLAALAVRNVDPQAIEASTTFGASSWQRLIGVRIPMAFDGIMLGANQVIMMAMSMVLITGLTGSQGLGYHLVSALRKPDTGIGVEAGLSVVVMGVLLDRLSQGLGARVSPTHRR